MSASEQIRSILTNDPLSAAAVFGTVAAAYDKLLASLPPPADRNDLDKQKHAKTPKKRPRHQCGMCEETFSSRAYVRTHCENVHFGGSILRLECDECGELFTNKSNLTRHKRKKHCADVEFAVDDSYGPTIYHLP